MLVGIALHVLGPEYDPRFRFMSDYAWAVFVCLAGIFRGLPLHDIASAVAIPSLVLAAGILSWSFRTAAGWQAIYPAAFLSSIGMFGAVVSIFVDIGMPGLQQRAFLFLLLLWLCLVV